MSFDTFCNICFMKQNIIKLCEEENEHIFNILISFTSCTDILKGIIYLCTNCCTKLEEYDKLKQLFLTNFVRFRYLYNEHREKLEMRNEPHIEMKLKAFVDVNVERSSGTPLIENYEYVKDSPGTSIIKKCEPSFHDEECNEFTNTDNVATSIPYDSSTYNESSNLASEDNYFEAEDIKLEKGEPSFCDGDYKELMKSENAATSIPYSSSRFDESFNLRAAQTNFEAVDIKIEKDEPKPIRFDELHDKNVSDNVGSVIPRNKSDDDSCDLSTNSKNGATEDTTIEGPRGEVNKAPKIREICNVCHKGFRAKSYLEVHMRTHTGERPFACDVCQKTFVNNSKLISHKRIHSGEKPYNCDFCNVKFRTSSALKIHKRTHTGEKPYSCDECNKTFRVMDSLKKHKRIHSGEKPYKCEECEMSFAQRGSLYLHELKHTGEKPYSCDECHKTFICATSLNRHIRAHKGEKPYECEECGLKFLESSDLKKHKVIHTSEKPYQCDECNKTFKKRSYLTQHKRIHTGENPYECDECGLKFRGPACLKIHKRKHTGERPFACDVCNKAFTQRTILITHKRIHTGDKPYKCDECDLSFHAPSILNIHKRRHTGERPFVCDVCNKTFPERSDLKRHKRTHTGEKPYHCDICQKQFSDNSYLNKHKRVHEFPSSLTNVA